MTRKSENSAYELYIDLHKNPELSFMEQKTAGKMAEQLRSLGFEVHAGIGGNGVVGILKNGKGPVIMLRTDMDALPIEEKTGFKFSSTVRMADHLLIDQPVMHACGHDMHMTVWLGTLKNMVSLKSEWSGTIIAVAQPAEEVSGGSSAMIADGLFKRFPIPDYALAYHVSPDLPAGTIGYFPGAVFAGVNSANIKIKGIGGHGAMPHTTIDPVVIAAQTIMALQTIRSRTLNPVTPSVITVGSIHGGTKHNIIPSEVDLQLTIRFFEEPVFEDIQSAIERITLGIASSAGLKEDLMPVVTYLDDYTPPVINNIGLVNNAVASMRTMIGDGNVKLVDQSTVSEDFGRYGVTDEKVKIALFWLGSVDPEILERSKKDGTMLPSLHNAAFLPDFYPTYRTGVSSMTRVMVDLFNKK